MTASFPWYDLQSVQWANDRIWASMYPQAPPLDRRRPLWEQWHSPELVISQACGLDLYENTVPIEPTFAPVFALANCPVGHYFSYLIGNPRGDVAAVNSLTSRSGCAVLLEYTRPSVLLLTGSHRASVEAVRNGSADFACIDAVIWQLLLRDAPEEVVGVEVAGRTHSATAPPYVVRAQANSDVRKRLCEAMADPRLQSARSALLLRGIKPVERCDYRDVFDEYERVRDRIPTVRRLSRAE